MSGKQIKDVLAVIEKVTKINSEFGEELIARLDSIGLTVIDGRKECDSIFECKVSGVNLNTVYFDKYWEKEYPVCIDALNKALDNYMI